VNTAIYCRISADREGAGLGVERQRADCEALARQRNWRVVGVYVDNDISAYSGRPRPEYRRLLADARCGSFGAILAWRTDRLHRSPRELEEFIDVCEEQKIRIETVRAGELDLKTPAGRAVARTLGAWARYESEHRSERVRRKMAELAQRGRPHGGGNRCFGYAADRMTLVEHEAAVLREATERLLAGETLRAICMDLNQRNLLTSTGNKWATRASGRFYSLHGSPA
jgi:DNA invertase Pin-like site-specific DNA recombinase